MMEKAQTEQETLQKKADMMRERLNGAVKEHEDNSKWLSLIRQYADIKELDREMLHLLIKEIVVRMLTFHYHFWDFRVTLREIFARDDIFVNDYALNNIALHLIIVIDRIRSQYILEGCCKVEKIENTKLYRVTRQIQ